MDDTSAYAKAVVNMLEDLSLEREHLADGQRAMVNILEDSVEEQARLHDTQQAVLNILEDLEQEQETIRSLNAELERRVARRTAQLAASNEALQAFAYSVSHDLRTPLRAIDGFSQALLEDYADSVDERGKDYLARVGAAAQRMGVLIEDVLRLSRVDRAEMHTRTLDISALAREIAGELREREPDRAVEFVLADGVLADGDPTLLRAVLENLLGNAWKFTAPHPAARIEFGHSERDGERVFFVRDDGVGFDMHYAEQLFAPFQRLHGTEEFPGTGIGLATVERVIRRHGGRVWAEAQPDKGATVYFTLAEAP